ncbi:aspartate-semialdehyde dehydrogenase [Gemmatimonas sp.]|jgi:aspartate-semialdehyde dehydrogenase|uniref:aspartate-semialdehyde dehydrogenase n=1 Tax=Gemmatimonas sp. TaxID=1962908 RepID=UPI0037BFC9F9
MTPSVTRWPVAVLGATGAVGQAFIRLLDAHPWFDLVEVAASERSAGKSYRDAAKWLEGTMPAGVASLVVKHCTPEEISAPIVFSALDSGVAGEVEPAFARAGRMVLSNAKNYRMDADVPLVIPEVNGDHLALLDVQRANRGWTGGIVTNANCATTVMAAALAPLHEAFTVTKVFATTMQAVSGAGYPGVPSLDILGNVIPFINDEEPKIETELVKLLGRFDGTTVQYADIVTSAHANRVPVEHGHTVCMSVAFARKPTPEEALEALRNWTGTDAVRGLPSAPEPSLIIRDEPDRPQPRRDVNRGRGMATTVGRVRADHLFDLRLVAMSHNVVRGAAGGSILNAELLAKTGQLARYLAP